MRAFLLFIMFGMAVGSIKAQSVETTLTGIMKIQSDAWNNGDVDGFMKYYWNDPELRFVSAYGVSKGWQQVYDNYKASYPDKKAMGFLTFDNLVFDKMNTKMYMVTGSWHLQKEAEAGGWFTLIFKKFKKDWLIIYDHTS